MPKTTNRPGLLLTILLIAEVCSAFEVSMIYAALPTLNKEFGDPASVSWVISACFLMSAIAAAICGRLGDLLGRKKILVYTLCICATGSLISSFSTGLGGVIVGSALQGVSGAILSLCFGLAREWLPPTRVPIAVGIITAAAALGAGAGLVIGGIIVDQFSWNTMFLVSGVYAIISALAVKLFIPDSAIVRNPFQKISMWRGVLFAPAIAGALLGIKQGPGWGWDWRALGLLVSSFALLGIWARIQWQAPHPLINLRLFTNRTVATAYVCMALLGLGALQIAQIMSIFLQQPAWTQVGFALSATAAGAILLPSNLLGLIASPVSGKIAAGHGARTAMLIAGLLLVIGWGLLALINTNIWLVGLLIMICAFGFNMMYSGIPNLIIEAVPEHQTSEATGLAAVVRATFMAIGAQIIGLLLASSSVTSNDPLITARSPDLEAFQSGFLYIAMTGLLCIVLTGLLPRRKYPHQAHSTQMSARNPSGLTDLRPDHSPQSKHQ